MTTKEELLQIRTGLKQEDVGFIFSTWLKGMYYGGEKFYRRVPKDVFFANYHKVIERILQTPGVVVKIACLKEDEDTIVGYAVYREAGGQTVADWVYVKGGADKASSWRGIGLARDLLPKDAQAFTHFTRSGEAVAAKLFPKAVPNPFLI